MQHVMLTPKENNKDGHGCYRFVIVSLEKEGVN